METFCTTSRLNSCLGHFLSGGPMGGPMGGPIGGPMGPGGPMGMGGPGGLDPTNPQVARLIRGK